MMRLCALLAVVVLGLGGTAAPHSGMAWWGPPLPGNATYEVRLAFVGYTGLATSTNCDAITNRQGYDSLVGTIKGFENPAEPDEDVVYIGTLTRMGKTATAPESRRSRWATQTA